MNRATKPAPTIDIALRAGCHMHVFLSGGGLRVVRLEDAKLLRGYGEGPVLEYGLRLAAEDFAAGGRSYAEVYGVEHPHYLTGQSTPSTEADAWVRRGATIDAEVCSRQVCVWMRGLAFSRIPDSILAEARVTQRPVQYVERGVLKVCEAHADGWATGRDLGGTGYREQFNSARVVKFGSGADFAEALAAAVACEETERPDER